MRPTTMDSATNEAEACLEQLAAELRAHERARLELVQRHEYEMAEAEARHQATCAALQARSTATEKAYRDTLVEIVALTRIVVGLEARVDAAAVARDEAEAALANRLDELRSTIASRDVCLSDARSCMAAAEEELAALRGRLAAGDGTETGEGDAPASDIALLRASALFDAGWYRRRYEDVDSAGMEPVEHYLLHGATELRDPGPAFSTAAYLGTNPDVAACGANALVHYLRTGLKEGRVGRLPPPPADEDA